MPATRCTLVVLTAALVMAGSIGAACPPATGGASTTGGFSAPAHTTTSTDPPVHLSACTPAAAATYLRARRHPYAEPTATPPTISAVTATTGICTVTLRGAFIVVGLPTPMQNTTLVGDTGRLLFGAHGGALLSVGLMLLTRSATTVC